MTFSESVELFLDYLRIERGLASNTAQAYGYDLERYEEFVNRNYSGDLSLVDHDGFLTHIQSLQESELSEASIERHYYAVRGFHRFLFREDLLESDCTKGDKRKAANKKLPTTLTPAEVEHLLSRPDTSTLEGLRDAAMLELLYSCALRISELTALENDSVIWERRLLRVRGKGDVERLIPVGEQALQKIRQYLLAAPNNGESGLFLTRLGRPFSRPGCWKMVRAYIKQADIGKSITPHSFRHTAATHLFNGGMGIREVQEFLGHADIATTEIYTHVTIDRLKMVHARCHPRG